MYIIVEFQGRFGNIVLVFRPGELKKTLQLIRPPIGAGYHPSTVWMLFFDAPIMGAGCE